MKLIIRYEDKFQTVELDDKEAESLWFSLSLEGDEECPKEEKERLIQKALDKQLNNPERRSWRSHSVHTGDAVLTSKDGVTELNSEEAIYKHACDHSIYSRYMDAAEVSNSYDTWRSKIREAFPQKIAEMLISIALDGMSVEEYATQIGDKPNNVSHRYCRAKIKFQKIFPRTVLSNHT